MRVAWLPLLVAAALSSAQLASAEGRERARAAYREGAAAVARGDYERAARAFGLADKLVPNVVALEQALKAAHRAENSILVMELAARAENRDGNRRFTSMVRALSKEHAARVGRVQLECPSSEGCSARVGRRRLRHGDVAFVEPGVIEVELKIGGDTEERQVEVAAGNTLLISPQDASATDEEAEPPTEVELPSPVSPVAAAQSAVKSERVAADKPGLGDVRSERRAAADRVEAREKVRSAPARSSGGGLSRGWFFGGLGLTAALAGGATLSGLDTAALHQRYQRSGFDRDRERGLAAQRRTNIIWGAAAAAAVSTAIVGWLLTDWGGASGVTVSPAGVSAHFTWDGPR